MSATTVRVVVGAVAGGLVTPPALLLAIMSGGAGHGHYGFMRALFPVPVLSTFNDSIGTVAIALAVVQFPLYGTTAGWGWSRGNWRPAAIAALMHIGAAALCFGGAVPNFS